MAHNPISFFCAVTSVILITLPLINFSRKPLHVFAKDMVKTAFLISLVPLALFMSKDAGDAVSNWSWLNLGFSNISLSLQFDIYPTIFMPVAFFVTWSILEFSIWYMHADPKINLFFKYLLIFLLAMVTLVCAGNMFILFIGWEGVGIMSFMLIGWYHARSNAAAAALQAVLYNRVGDIGFLMALCWLMKNSASLELQSVLAMKPSTMLLVGFIAAAASKSAQFSLHPWLASAMEGPTPVSALLHSSTMVVAGIYLLIRIHPLLAQNQTALTICLCLGAISTAFAATCAITQNDIKKIIAYSTSSQLGLMMVAIGISFPHLAFFHICTHAFFKAMLFLCSGIIIHNLNDEQDIRKMGGLQLTMPVTTTCLSVGSLALMGTPFLAGFYSKDAIIESMNTSMVNSTALLLTLIATSFTAVYSLRLIYFASMDSPRSSTTLKFNENDPLILNSIMRLATGSIIAGLVIFHVIIPNDPVTHTMPTLIKLAALILTVLALFVAYDLAKLYWTSPINFTNTKEFDPLFYNQVVHRAVSSIMLDTSWRLVTHLVESILLKKTGPDYVENSQLHPITIVRVSQKGMIKLYLSALFITLVFVLLFLQLA
uniref:NADH-ubiquinone oxidoreductase chain 5 n=1 Tax=Tomopterna cryptotis TaxID=143410 RepID=S4V0T1_9NEOB|nr:NADH dehydrogenase subunit 5 [Tomopterna cryptotis]